MAPFYFNNFQPPTRREVYEISAPYWTVDERPESSFFKRGDGNFPFNLIYLRCGLKGQPNWIHSRRAIIA
jgi:hypothetical protein